MAEYPRKKKYPERQFTSEDAMQNYFSTLQDEENDKRAMNIIHNLYLLSPGYAGSSEATYNANQISKGSTSTAGLATRYRLMNEADKERVSKEFTTIFQAEDFPDMETFYRCTKTMGPWYNETLLRQHESIAKNRLDAMKSTKVGEAVDTLFGEYSDEWLTADYAEQNKVRTDIAESDAIKSLPSKWRSTAIEEIFNRLKGMLSPTGQYAAAGEARSVQQEADRVTDLADARADEVLKETSEALSARVVQEAIGLMDKDSDLTRNEALNKAIAMLPGGRTQILDEQELKRRFDLFIPKEDAPPGTKPVYNPETDSTVFASDAEIAADDSLVPTAAESNLDPDTARIGALMAVKGEMPNDVWKKYYKGGMDLLYNSLVGPDAEHIKKWLLQVEEYKAKTAAGASINLELLQGGAVTGQTDDGITGIRIKQ